MKLEFNWKYKDYELRAVPKMLVRLDEDEENETIELLKWDTRENGERYCFTMAYWIYTDDDGYELRLVGNRMFNYIETEDIAIIWEQMKLAKEALDDFESDKFLHENM